MQTKLGCALLVCGLFIVGGMMLPSPCAAGFVSTLRLESGETPQKSAAFRSTQDEHGTTAQTRETEGTEQEAAVSEKTSPDVKPAA